ncbi:MAG: subtilisin family serine protease [Chlamydiales bacterium]|jgi:subtilisin family serine protease
MIRSVFACVLATVALTSSAGAQVGESSRVEMPGEMVVSFETDGAQVDLEAVIAAWGLQTVNSGLRLDEARSLLQWQRRGAQKFTNVVLIEYSPATIDGNSLRAHVAGRAGVVWAAPNNSYNGDPRELVPNDPQYGSQYHHPLMQNDAAWNITLGDASVIIGITDDGFDTDHADLAAGIWVNPGETPGDGIDNDANGYIDDVNGFDFVFNNNDPNPNNTGDDHGTHVAGIAGARTNNGVGVAGTAGAATIMPLQFYSSSQSWTAAIIAESFAYGADNGARIMTTSYNINGWVGDPVVTAGFDYIYDMGVLHFNSAGNGSEANPARQAFHQTMLVVNTDSSDQKSSSSNWGTGVDITAPGSSILSTILNDAYGFKSGTSMASPNAAGVAALIWSANPGWTRDQVAAQLHASADNIDAQNPGLEGLLGGGRVNSFNALTQTLPAPRVASQTGLPAEGALLAGDLSGFRMRFDQIMDPAAVNDPSAFSLVYAGVDGAFGTGDDAAVGLTWDEYLIAGNELVFTVTGTLGNAGKYRFNADAAVVTNPFATALDGNADGAPGDSWTRTFDACATLVLLEDNAESGADWSVVNVNLQAGSWGVPPVVPTGGGVRSDPPTDFDGSGKCFLTQDGPGNTDVDGGPTRLISRAFDVSAIADPYLSYARWFVATGGDDVMTVEVSNGGIWNLVESLGGTAGWEVSTFRVSDFVTPNAAVRMRFSVTDVGTGTIVEAGIDQLRIVDLICQEPMPVGTNYCIAATNTTGVGATIGAVGSDLVAGNDFTLITGDLPAGVPGLYYFGPNQIQAPFGEGFRCVGGATQRIQPPAFATAQGVTTRVLDLTAPPAAGSITPGANLNFQLWYRDAMGGPEGFNLSDGLNVIWQ